MQLLVVLLLASVVLFSTAMLVIALMMRGQWDKIGSHDSNLPGDSSAER